MKPEDVKKYYKSAYNFHKQTKMSRTSYQNWNSNGFVPIKSQIKLHQLTKGALKVELPELPEEEK